MMKIKRLETKLLLAGIIVFTAIFFTILTGTHAAATANQEEIEKMRENYTELGIDKETGEKLIQKVLNGELLDSQKPEKLKGKKLTVDIKDKKGNYVEFDDGSRILLTFEEEKASEITALSASSASAGTVSNRSCGSGSGYTYCDVTARYQDMVWDIKFDAKVTKVSGGQAKISDVVNNKANLVLYSILSKQFGVVKARSDDKGPAKTRWQFQISHKDGSNSITRNLALYADSKSTYARLE
ncbi:hypothetical protein [Planococcus sp. CAU13]|uniref:hypothetical protein n=1 Tax=Planococcus sp. CAU13 TaxID=1541197 RepID=UPI00052FFFFD|nr:hypothetical protein [Planococcus sp. CAU13]